MAGSPCRRRPPPTPTALAPSHCFYARTCLIQVWIDATSASGVLLSSWVGRSGGLEVRRAVYFGESDFSIYMHTTIVNIGSNKLFDVRYLRSIDPDQEYPWSTEDVPSYATNNYVKFQYQASLAGV